MAKKKNYFNDKQLFIVLNTNDFAEVTKFLAPYGIESYDRDGRTMLLNLIIEKKEELLKAFMQLNPNINHQDFYGYTALHFALQEKFNFAIDLLLAREDLQIDLQDNWGFTALHRLVMEHNPDDIELIKRLLAKGASLDVYTETGASPRLEMQKLIAAGIVDYSQLL